MALTIHRAERHFTRISTATVAANGANSSDQIDTSAFMQGSFQVVHAAHSDTSTWVLQCSLDGGTSFDTITGTSTTTSGASGSASIYMSTLPGGLVKLLVTETDGGANSTLQLHFVGKVGR